MAKFESFVSDASPSSLLRMPLPLPPLHSPSSLFPTNPIPLPSIQDLAPNLLADSLAFVLRSLCDTSQDSGFPSPLHPSALFYSPSRQKNFSLEFYCRRLVRYNSCSNSCYAIALLYLNRMSQKDSVYELNDFNVHRLFCTASVVAAKWLDDVSYSCAHYAKVGGIGSGQEMARLEAMMLDALGWRTFVVREAYEDVEVELVKIAVSFQPR